MKLWMLGWPGNQYAEMGYMLFSYTSADTEEEAKEKFRRAKNREPYSVVPFPEQNDLEEWKRLFKKTGELIE